jgi:heterodisulfide reductase subunit C
LFLEELLAMPGGEALLKCMQCGTCSGSCPTSYQMDFSPRRLITMIKAGMKQEVLNSSAIWLCASCYSCSVRCPRGIEFTEIMYLLKSMAIKEGILPPKHDSSIFYQTFSEIVTETGRMNESKLITNYAMKTDYTRLWKQFAPLGMKLMRRGRIALFPAKIKNKAEFSALMKKALQGREA